MISFQLKARQLLDSPWGSRSVFFWIFSPVLFAFSMLIAILSSRRRKAGYSPLKRPSPLVVCVGNVLIGGTGKSPIVRMLAQEFLSKGFQVAIFSRGYQAEKKALNAHFHRECPPEDFGLLSDENREHWELINAALPGPNLHIFQNPVRSHSYDQFINFLMSHNLCLKNSVCILDDGLQHFGLGRHVNICMWTPKILVTAPLWPFPVGPFREGNPFHFQSLFSEFPIHLWSRCLENHEDFEEFKEVVRKSLKKCFMQNNVIEGQHFTVIYKTRLVQFEFLQGVSGFRKFETEALKLAHNSRWCIITGISNPEQLVLDCKRSLFEIFSDSMPKFETCFLPDHGALTEKALHIMNNSEVIIFTLKDYSRWKTEESFAHLLRTKVILGLFLETKLWNADANDVDLSQLVLSQVS